MTLKTGPADIIIPYAGSGATYETLAANYEVFFTALDKTNCPVTSCVLSDIASCGTPLTGGNVVIGSDPWAITAKQDNTAGYTSLVCVQCTIRGHTFDWKGADNPNDGWKII